MACFAEFTITLPYWWITTFLFNKTEHIWHNVSFLFFFDHVAGNKRLLWWFVHVPWTLNKCLPFIFYLTQSKDFCGRRPDFGVGINFSLCDNESFHFLLTCKTHFITCTNAMPKCKVVVAGYKIAADSRTLCFIVS